jgi:nucleotide-binding universal stress UspA family protein
MDGSDTYRHIVVAIDGTRESQCALEHAARLARSSHARLDLLAVATVSSTTYWGGAVHPMELVEQLYADIVRRAAASVPDLPVTTYLAKGSPAAAIVDHAEQHDCDLIVMGTRGRIRAIAALFGSTSRGVLRRARVPVLLVDADMVEDRLATLEAVAAEAAV